MAGQIYQDKNLNGNDILDAGKVTVQNDASGANDLTRKSQVEAIADTTTQAAIVNSLASPNSTTALDTAQLQAQLNTKQNNLSIKPDSTLYLTLVDSVLGFTNLGRGPVLKDTTSANFTAFLATCTFNGDDTITVGGTVYDSGTQIFLTASTVPTETVYIYTGGNAGTSADFINDSDKYDASEVRALLSVTGVGINYDSNTGVTSLVFGTGGTDLGGQTLPHGAAFTTITPTAYTSSALEKLEVLINDVDQSGADGTAAVTTRINNLSGVTGSNMGSFTGSLFVDGQNIKQLLQASETAHESATADRAAIRSENSARATTVDAAISSEASTRASDISSEASTRASEDSTLQTNINTVSTNLSTETSRATSAEVALDGRLDIVEGAGVGSISKAQTDAQDYADAAVLVEKTRAESAESALDTKIDNLQEGDITYVGKVVASQLLSIRADRIAAGDTRNGLNIKDVAIKAGEVFVIDVAQTVTFDDASTIVGQVGDKLMATETVSAGSVDNLDFNITQADGSAITVANIGSSTIELNGSDQLDIVTDSIGRTQLDSSIEADVDDKVSLTANGQTITGDSLLIDQSHNNLGSSYGLFLRTDQTGSEALTGTCRALLVENKVNTAGSANPALPSYAHNSITTHYDGSSNDLSVVVSGAYNESNVTSGTAAVIANGSYSVSTDAQLGINIGSFMAAENAAVSNISAFAFAGTDGAGADRGVVGAISNLDVATYSGTRQADPYPYNDIAIVADAKYAPAGSKALYTYGDVVMEGGTVVIPASSGDTNAVNAGELKAKQKRFKMDTTSGTAKTFASGLDLSKCLFQVVDDGQAIDVSVSLNSGNGEITVTATGGNLTDLVLLVIETICDETVIS